MQQHVFTIAQVCQQFGVKHAVICPGSRSAPLSLAFIQLDGIDCYSIIDERSAGFVAMGMAQQLQEPVVLISTSGTACLNFFPAIAEAYYQKIPLLVLTADRPPELLNQQDGQMIMQKGVFGKHVLSSHELLCFEEDKIDYRLTERIVLTSLEECMNEHGYGPVHINVPLREPLYNIPKYLDVPQIMAPKGKLTNSSFTSLPKIDTLASAWKNSRKKMVLVGQMPPSLQVMNYLKSFEDQDDVVILTDIASNQHENCNVKHFDCILQFESKQLLDDLAPDLLISFGGPMVSKSLKIWLKGLKPEYHFRIQAANEMVDTYQNVTHPIHANVMAYLRAFQSLHVFNNSNHKPYISEWKFIDEKVGKLLQNFVSQKPWSEPSAMQRVLDSLPDNSLLQLGNSSTVRWASWLGLKNNGLQVFSNRGTSGIDGTTSTAIGSARIQNKQIVTLILGDLSLFYDQNAFWQKNLPSNLRIIVINNNCGNIFNWIDGPGGHPEELEYFTTPHQLSVAKLCEQHGLTHLVCERKIELAAHLNMLYEPSKMPMILELRFEEKINLEVIKEFRKMKC